MRKKLFTHTDLDGVGCAIVGYHAYPDDIDVTYCDYHNVNEIIANFLKSDQLSNYHHVFITDISVNEEVAQMINPFGFKFTLLDHHDTARWLNKYDWAHVWVFTTDYNGKPQKSKSCGTYAFLEFLEQNAVFEPSQDLADLVEDIRQYDTWEWSTVYNAKAPKMLNDLFGIYGRDRFIERFIDDESPDLSLTEKLIIELRQEEIDRYIKQKEKQLIGKVIKDHTVGIVFADRFQSELGNELAKRHPEFDVIAMIDPSKTISYRSVKERVHVGEFAMLYGGGGHAQASGSPISKDKSESIIDDIFFGLNPSQ